MKALGDYCGGVPPLPIPNREVKTASADGTAHCCGRVGRRHSFETPFLYWDGVFFVLKSRANEATTRQKINLDSCRMKNDDLQEKNQQPVRTWKTG